MKVKATILDTIPKRDWAYVTAHEGVYRAVRPHYLQVRFISMGIGKLVLFVSEAHLEIAKDWEDKLFILDREPLTITLEN